MASAREGRKPLCAALLFAAGCGATTAAGPSSAPPAPAAQAAAAPARRFTSPYSYEWFVRAELLAARGQDAAAVEAYRMALTSADEDPYVLARLAEALDRSGDRQGAAAALATGLQIDPRAEAVWLARGRIAARRGELERAFEAYERAEAAAPTAADAPFALAGLLERSGHPERAIAVLERFAARSDGGSTAALRAQLALARARGDGAALAEAARRVAARGGGEAELVRRVAAELLAAGEAALAARLLAALAADAQDARLRLDAALALQQADTAELLLATTPPEQLGGLLAVAEAYLAIGRPDRALEALAEQSAAAEADPARRALAHAHALLALGRPDEAALSAARVARGSQYHPAAVQVLAQALQTAGLPALSREVTDVAREPTHPVTSERSEPRGE